MAPRKSRQRDIDQKGRAVLEDAFSEQRLAPQPDTADLGIDYTLEFINPLDQGGEVSGTEVDVQLKSKERLCWRRGIASIRLETDKLAYYIDNRDRPVYLIAVDVETRMGYWCCIQDAVGVLQNNKWRTRESATIHVPKSQSLGDIAALRKHAEEALVRVRSTRPVAMPIVVKSEEARLEAIDPRFRYFVTPTRQGTETTIHAKQDVQFTLALTGTSREIIEAAYRDFYEKGLPISAKTHSVDISIDGLPVVPSESFSSLVIRTERKFESRITLQNPRTNRSIDFSTPLSGGAKELRGSGTIGGVLSMSIRLGAEIWPRAALSVKIDFAPWRGRDVRRLPHFDTLNGFLADLEAQDELVADIWIDGDWLARGSCSHEFAIHLKSLGCVIRALDQLRQIARIRGVDVVFPRTVTDDDLKVIDKAYQILLGNGYRATIRIDPFSVAGDDSLRRLAESRTCPGHLSNVVDEYIVRIFNQGISLGPVRIQTESVVVEVTNVLESSDGQYCATMAVANPVNCLFVRADAEAA